VRELVKDLPRLGDGTAMIADPRNDEHLIIAGLHCAFILFHNRAVDHARANGSTTVAEAFPEARRLTTWHYHWIVLNEFLPQIVGQAMVDEVVEKGREVFIPSRRARRSCRSSSRAPATASATAWCGPRTGRT